MRLKIRRFDPSTMKEHRVIYFIGRRGTGKTTLLQSVIGAIANRCDIAIGMSPTHESAQMLRSHIPAPLVFDGHAPSKVDALIDAQKRGVAANKPRNAFLVWDDLMYDKGILRSKAIRELHMNGRHLKIAFLNSVQYLMDVDIALRSQVDYVFALRESIQANKIKLHKFFFGICPTFAEFSKLLDACTQEYSCLVLDNTAVTNQMEDCLFWYKAEMHPPPFRLGRQIYWDLARRHTRTDPVASTASVPVDQKVTSVTRTDIRGRVIPEDVKEGDVVILQ
jgi:energy-coupling factor transporter ATP-binding protein EcfA2